MIYIQKNEHDIPHHFDCACAMYGAIELGLDYKLVSFEEVPVFIAIVDVPLLL